MILFPATEPGVLRAFFQEFDCPVEFTLVDDLRLAALPSTCVDSSLPDRATYLDPALPSQGVRHVLVGGSFAVRDGALQKDAMGGAALRGVPR